MFCTLFNSFAFVSNEFAHFAAFLSLNGTGAKPVESQQHTRNTRGQSITTLCPNTCYVLIMHNLATTINTQNCSIHTDHREQNAKQSPPANECARKAKRTNQIKPIDRSGWSNERERSRLALSSDSYDVRYFEKVRAREHRLQKCRTQLFTCRLWQMSGAMFRESVRPMYTTVGKVMLSWQNIVLKCVCAECSPEPETGFIKML